MQHQEEKFQKRDVSRVTVSGVYENWQEKYNDNRLHNFQNREMHVKNDPLGF
jgi:hypothetical protein